MYSLNSDYYTKEFDNIDDLIQDAILSGMDPMYEITYNGKGTGEMLLELLVF
jgi:hypothetical protein